MVCQSDPKTSKTNPQSAFSPLNLAEDPTSKKDLEEAYSREFEIEDAFKTFEQAISLQNKGNYLDAYTKYKEMAKKDVILSHYYEETEFTKGLQNGGLNTKPDELSFLPQNVKSIRFLYFRNRGFLYFNVLRKNLLLEIWEVDQALEKSKVLEIEFANELFYSMVDDFVNCFVYQEADDALVHVVHDIFVFMDLKKLARFSLEYAVTLNSEGEDIASVIPMNQWAIPVWDAFKKHGLTDTDSIIAEKLNFLLPMKQDLQQQVQKKFKRNVLQVSVKLSSGWLEILQAFNSALKQAQDREKTQELSKTIKYIDPYLTSESTLDAVQYEFRITEDEVVEATEVKSEQPEQDVKKEEEERAIEGQASIADAVEAGADIPMDIPEDAVVADSQELKSEALEETALQDVPDSADVSIVEPVIGQPALEGAPAPERTSGRTVQRSSRRLNGADLILDESQYAQLTRKHYIETELFFNHLNENFGKIFSPEEPLLLDVVRHIIDTETSSDSPLYVADFLNALNDGDRKLQFEHLFSDEKATLGTSKAETDKMKLLDVLTQFGNQSNGEAIITTESLNDREDYHVIKQFLEDLPKQMHVSLAKLEILHHLMGCDDKHSLSINGNCLITDTLWSPSLYSHVREWVMQIEPDICKSWTMPKSSFMKDFCLSVSVFEILIDSYIIAKVKVEKWIETNSKPTTRATFNNASIELLRLEDRLNKWTDVFYNIIFKTRSPSEIAKTHLLQIVRFMWASNYRIASQSFTWKEKKYVVLHLYEVVKLLEENESQGIPQISFPNYSNIGAFNTETLHRRLTTSSILSIFSKILYGDSLEENSNEDTIELLESILIEKLPEVEGAQPTPKINSLVVTVIHGKATLDGQSLKSVREFLEQCPIDLKLSLWNILFLYYKENKSFERYQKGYERVLEFLLEYLTCDKYAQFKGDRINLFLNAINCYGKYVKTFLTYLSEHRWKLPNDSSDYLGAMLHLSKFFELCYCFSLHEEGALITSAKISVQSRSIKAFQNLKDFCIDCIIMLLVYSVNYINQSAIVNKDEAKSDLLILMHSQLGLRRLCDASEGLYLRFTEDTLVSVLPRPDQALAQLLSCKHHYKVKIHGQYPIDHYTTKTGSFSQSTAHELANFILPICFRDNPLLKLPRNDLKQVVDDIYVVVEPLDYECDKLLVQNNLIMEKFFDQTIINARFVKETFHGLYNLDLQTPKVNFDIAHAGLYYLEAIFMFNSYKIKKKSAQSRTVELERIIRVLQDDLIYGSNRVESWILLGHAYGFIVEDDLIWTSDKLNMIERKVVTANLQRKSLLSYMMAINTLTQAGLTEHEHFKPVISILMNSFVKEMYSAVSSPMEMIAFKVHHGSKFVRKKNSQTMFQVVAERPAIPLKFCLKLMQQCLHLAIKSNSEEWSTFYYLAKIRAKLGKSPSEVLEPLLVASTLCKKQGTPADPILEALYKLYAFLYKYVKTGKITVTQAIEYLKRDTTLQLEYPETISDKHALFTQLIVGLEKMMTLDKRSWYHKPCYRMAVIYYDEFDDYKKAREIISKFFSLKISNKTFLQMWKPEHERPGRHFVYMYQYTQFYIKLLRRELDLSSLVLMLPKLRRANSTMIMLNFAWENICASICKLIRVIAKVEENFVENFLLYNTYHSFMAQAKTVVEKLKSDTLPENLMPFVCYLHVINDMRKLNNGFGPTSLIDDTICAVFLKLYNHQLLEQSGPINVSKDSPNGKMKKLAKRDLFPFVNDLLTKCKRDVESYIKERPNIFNDYVASYIEAKRIESTQAQPNATGLAGTPLPAPVFDEGALPPTTSPTIFITRKIPAKVQENISPAQLISGDVLSVAVGSGAENGTTAPAPKQANEPAAEDAIEVNSSSITEDTNDVTNLMAPGTTVTGVLLTNGSTDTADPSVVEKVLGEKVAENGTSTQENEKRKIDESSVDEPVTKKSK